MGIVQKLTPVKDSIIWSFQEKYARSRGPDLLKEELISEGAVKNCLTADAYAAMAAAFLRDLAADGITAKPLFLEVGGGTGRFAWMFLNRLCNYQFGDDETLPAFDYILTDPAQSCVESWRKSSRFRPLVERGLVRFGRMDIAPDPSIDLGDETLKITNLGDRPVVLISNYQFNALPSDLLQVNDHALQRVLLRLTSEEPDFDPANPTNFDALREHFSVGKGIKAATGHAPIDAILADYAKRDGTFYVSVPETAFRFLEGFTSRKAPCLFLTAEQAYIEPEEFDLDSPFVFEEHFEQFVNFDIIAEQFRRAGGTVEFGTHPDSDFACGAFLSPGADRAATAFGHTAAAASKALNDFNPGDAHELLTLMEEAIEEPSYRQMFAWLRQSKFDPRVAEACLPFMFEELEQGHEDPDGDTIAELFGASYNAYYPEGEKTGFDIRLAQLFLAVGIHEEALALIETGIEDYGDTPARHYVRALALLKLDRPQKAREAADQSLALDPDYGPSIRFIADKLTPKKAEKPKAQTLADLSAHLATNFRDHDVRVKAWDIFKREGVVLIDNMLQDGLLEELRASYDERIENWRKARIGKPNNVGDKRFTVPIRVKPPFNNPNLFANPVLMDILTEAMGEKPVLSAFGAVVTRQGARAQHIHREHPLLFHNDAVNVQLPCYAVNVLFPLIDLDEEAGGTQVWERTHLTEEDYQWQGESTKCYTKTGSALCLDYRVYHGGMPCQATHNRPLLFLSYAMPWFTDTLAFDSHAAVAISEAELKDIPEEHREMFKFAKRIPD